MAVIDLRPKIVDLALYSGDSLAVRVNVLDPALIDGATWMAHVRRKRPATAILAEFTVAPDANGATLSLTAAQTTTLAGVQGVWDVQVTRNGSVRTLAQGKATFDVDVTR